MADRLGVPIGMRMIEGYGGWVNDEGFFLTNGV